VLGTHSLGLFAATVFVVNATPGVDMLFVATRTLRHGVDGGSPRRSASPPAAASTRWSPFGLATLLAASSATFALVKWPGAAYLLARHQHAAASRDRAVLLRAPAATPVASGGSACSAKGHSHQYPEPQGRSFFLALLPQFIAADAAHGSSPSCSLAFGSSCRARSSLIAFVLLVAPLRRRRASIAPAEDCTSPAGHLARPAPCPDRSA
jgi:threonine/homoserine/homoserine lactone efflux protein